jgi:FtsZ-binding cell division protein ZapB
MSTPAPEEDALASLEERIRRTVELVTSLREERDAAVAERDAARIEMKKLRDEVESMRGERKQVRTRIEKLLGQMDVLSGA